MYRIARHCRYSGSWLPTSGPQTASDPSRSQFDIRGIKERFGLSTGDAILAETGRRLREAPRDADIVVRVGSDEFILLIENIGPTDASSLLGALDALARPFRVGGRDVTVHSSGVIAYIPQDADNTDELTRMASSAAQRDKQAGGGHAVLYTGDVAPEREELEMTPSRYDTAVQNGEFQLHYQPIVNLKTGAAVSWEALARWKRGSDVLPTAAFLPAAERNGVIIPFGTTSSNRR